EYALQPRNARSQNRFHSGSVERRCEVSRHMRVGLMAAVLSVSASVQADEALRTEALRHFGRLEAPSVRAEEAARVELGRALFWDTRVSLDRHTACASCHSARDWSADRRAFSTDARGKLTRRHSQPVFNAMQQASLRWTGDRNSGRDQARGSMTGSLGFESTERAVAHLRSLGYAKSFAAAFPD